MKLRDIYAQPGLKLSVEFFPPRTDAGRAQLLRELDVLRTLSPAFCSVTYGAAGSTRDATVELVEHLHHELGLEVMCHLTVVGQSRDEVRDVLARLRGGGIENVIALRGDPPRDTKEWTAHPDGFRYSVELVREARSHGDWFSVAVAGFPEVHPEAASAEADLEYLEQKVSAGADVVITQLFFDNDDFYRYVDAVRAHGVEVPVVPGLLPILSAAQTYRFTALCGAKIPPLLRALLERVEDDDEAAVRLGIDYATEQARGLIEFGVPGIHFYSLNRSRSIREIARNLALAPSPSPPAASAVPGERAPASAD